jgi:CubicO group peptidase (beta-lactamase class C family)
MSISKMAMNLIIGRLVDEGRVRLDERLAEILPWIGAGYSGATLQDVLDMNVHNGFDEDYQNPDSMAFRHEVAIGMRLPSGAEPTNRDFVAGIGLAQGTQDTRNPTGNYLYKSANTEILGYVAEARGGRALGGWLAELADAAGFERALHIGTDRTGFPVFSGGICLTARDLCRYGALFAREGKGVDEQPFGSAGFIAATRKGGVPMLPPREHLRYSNQCNTDGTWLGHGGYGGQYLVANPETGRVACFLSVLQDEAGYDADYYPPVIAMLAGLCAA